MQRSLFEDFHCIVYHRSHEAGIWPVSVLPFLLIIIMNILLFWYKPAQVSKTLLWLSVVCLLIDFLSTVFIQAPWNYALSKGKDVELMQNITDTNWLRVFLETSQVIVVFMMLKKFALGITGKGVNF